MWGGPTRPPTFPRRSARSGGAAVPGAWAGWSAVGVLLLAGCTSVADVTGTATQSDLLQLRTEIAQAQQTATRARSEAEVVATRAVDARLRAQTTESDRQLTALTRRLDGLSASLGELTARLDEVTTRLESLSRQVRSTAQAAPVPPPAVPRITTGPSAAPLAAVTPPGAPPSGQPPSEQPPTATPSPGTPPTSTPPVSVSTRPATNALQPQDIYQAAYIDFSKGSYALAVAGFREFLRRFPDHPLAGNAQYWIGESHFSLARGHINSGQAEQASQEMEQAVQEFRKVLAGYPRGEKAPTALYKEALALLELKQPALAQERLEYLIANFPQAQETSLARERLVTLKGR